MLLDLARGASGCGADGVFQPHPLVIGQIDFSRGLDEFRAEIADFFARAQKILGLPQGRMVILSINSPAETGIE
jgi:hypothetical protein